MAKLYREIKIITSTQTLSVDVRTENENVTRNELATVFETTNGTRWKFKRGSNTNYTYTFNFCNESVFSFFESGYTAGEITFERELDDGTFESFAAFLNQPQYQDDSIDDTGNKVYRGVTIEVLSA